MSRSLLLSRSFRWIVPAAYQRSDTIVPKRSQQTKRQFHDFSDGRPQVIIGNNSVLSAVYSQMRFLGTEQYKQQNPGTLVVATDHWQDYATPENLMNFDWGQSTSAYCYDTAEIINTIKPPKDITSTEPFQQDDDLLKWVHDYQTRKTIHHFLAESGIEFVTGKPIITPTADGYHIQVGTEYSNTFPHNTHFTNWYHIDNKHNYEGITHQPSHLLYRRHPRDIPKVIISVGGGPTTVWLPKHFPESIIICLLRHTDPPLESAILPSSANVDLSNTVQLRFDPEDEQPFAEFLTGLTGSKEERFFDVTIPEDIAFDHPDLPLDRVLRDAELFCSTGVVPNDISHVVQLSNRFQPSPLSANNIWIAPKNIPLGAKPGSKARIFSTHGHMQHHFTPQAFLLHDLQHMLQTGLRQPVDGKFYRLLQQRLQSMDNPVYRTDEAALYIDVFEQAYPGQNSTNFAQDIEILFSLAKFRP